MRYRALIATVVITIGLPVTAVAGDVPAPPGTTPATTASPFLPEDVDVGDCLSALPQPECGSEEQGGPGQALAFVALVLGMAFIGWRIARGVRQRERATSAER